MTDTDPPLLSAANVEAGYAGRPVLHGVSVTLNAGEILLLMGHNGAGKSTLIKAIFGLLPLSRGEIRFRGTLIRTPDPRWWLRHGVSYLPQGNRVFPNLTVRQNLQMGGTVLDPAVRQVIDRALGLFPDLGGCLDRRAETLSGGMKQMLALGTAMVSSPRVMLLDEPLLGLAVHVARQLVERLDQLKREGVGLLIVDHRVKTTLPIADRAVIIRSGTVTFDGKASDLRDGGALKRAYL